MSGYMKPIKFNVVSVTNKTRRLRKPLNKMTSKDWYPIETPTDSQAQKHNKGFKAWKPQESQ